MKAIIYKSTGSWYIVKADDGCFYNCRIKGKFKVDKTITSTNPIAVGDIVTIELEDIEEKTGIITSIDTRKNYLIRQSPHNKHLKHIVASNVDQSIIVATLKSPVTSLGFIDRFLVMCEAYSVSSVLVFNKSDLLDNKDLEYYEYIKNIYENIGIRVELISAENNNGLETFLSILKNKTSLITGHSGVGKSTLVNKVLPHKEIVTQEVSEWSGKGMHTTTFAEMHDLLEGGQLIDTPGIRELGVVTIAKKELSSFFPEMKKRLGLCKYNNCLHFNEPNCAIKAAVKEGDISEERYVSYAKIFESIEEIEY